MYSRLLPSMSYCSKSGQKILPDSNFCHGCGKRLEQSTKRETQRGSGALSSAIDQCKVGTQTLIHATNQITDNIVQIQNAKSVDGALMSETLENINTFLSGVKKLKKGIANIEQIQPDASSNNSRSFSFEYIEYGRKVIASSGNFFNAVDFEIRYTQDGTDKSMRLSQLAKADNPETVIRKAHNLTLHGEQITRSAGKLVNNCELFIGHHNELFGQSEQRI